MQFFGALTALVTPFKNGAVDEAAYREFIEFQISEGIHGLVPCGTTGESATLSHEEHERVIEICIDQVKGRVPVLAGAGSNNTIEAIRLTRFAQKAGADGALLITPYYNKPTQEGLYRHFKAIAEAVDMPLVPYNVPGRTGTNLLPATLSRLAHEFPNIVGVKEATGDMSQCSLIMEQCPKGFSLLSARWPPCTMPSPRAISPPPWASIMTSSSCIRPCSWKATPSRSRPPWLSWAA